MYPVSLGYAEAERRISRLLENGHYAEALVTVFFTIEKTLKRTLIFSAIRRGFTSKQAQDLFGRSSFKDLKEMWHLFYKEPIGLPDLFSGSSWQHICKAQEMRNRLVHGQRVFKLDECHSRAQALLAVHRELREKLMNDIGFDGWSRLPTRRKCALPWLDEKS